MASDSQAASSYVSLVGSEAPAASSSARLSSASRDDAREEVPKVAVLPSGEMVYLSKDNPYARTYVEHADTRDLDPSERPDEDSASVPVPEPLLASFQQPLILERMGRIVRLLAMFDLILSLMNVLAQLWPAAITAIMAYCGYVGARMFRRDLTRVYLVYLVFIAIVRISVTVHLSVVSSHHESGEEEFVAPAAQVFLVVSSVLQIVIAHFVWKFYSLLPTTEEESRFVQYIAENQAGRGLL